MRSSFPLIAGNGLAIALTVVIVLPVIAVLAFAGTAPLDDFTANMGLALHALRKLELANNAQR